MMCVVLNDSLKHSRYGFLVKAFNLPSTRTISEYNSIGGNSPNGILYDVLESILLPDGEMRMMDGQMQFP